MKIKTEMIIDCSGSMAGVIKQVEQGVREYAHDMKDGDWLSITEFEGGKVLKPHTKVSWRGMIVDPYQHYASGMTNLYDAVGSVLTKTLKKKSMKGRVVVITTDGFENCSKEFTRDTIKALVKKFEKRGGSVMYLSSAADPFGDAMAMGIDVRNTSAYTSANTSGTFSAAASAKERLRSGGDIGFTEEEKKDLVK
jgi:hypothetical protein